MTQWQRICLLRCGFSSWVRNIPWSRNLNPLQYSCMYNFMDRGAWWATVHGVAKESDMTEQECIKTWRLKWEWDSISKSFSKFLSFQSHFSCFSDWNNFCLLLLYSLCIECISKYLKPTLHDRSFFSLAIEIQTPLPKYILSKFTFMVEFLELAICLNSWNLLKADELSYWIPISSSIFWENSYTTIISDEVRLSHAC